MRQQERRAAAAVGDEVFEHRSRQRRLQVQRLAAVANLADGKLSLSRLALQSSLLTLRASDLADRFFDAPSGALDVIGVTGTNGKTTCAWLLAQALDALGRPAAYLGTLGASFAGERVAGEMTTPDAITAQRQLAAFRDRGARAVAMEVSSHGLVQGRVAAVRFDAAVFTNLTRDHLDFHGDMQAYGAAKASLFERAQVRLRVFNTDDPFGARLAARPALAGRIACSREARPAGGEGAHVFARDIAWHADGTSFTLDSSFGEAPVHTRLLGEFNVDNTLAVLAVLLGSGMTPHAAAHALAEVSAPPGRMESFAGTATAVVDYAHSPDALEKALAVLRRHCAGRLTVVFGCGGERDRGKRAVMGGVAARGADAIVLTDDNPRGEDGAAIIADIQAGLGAVPATVIRDRRQAIEHALLQAREGDVVLVAGKGHESYQLVEGEARPFSDRAVVRGLQQVRA